MKYGDIISDGTAKFRVKSPTGMTLVGEVTYFAGDTPPTGWLVCDGRAVSREEYFELFNVIGTKYGAGDGSTTFNLPNETDGRFREGGTEAGAQKEAGLPDISGTVENTDHMYYLGGGIEADGAFRKITSNDALRVGNDDWKTSDRGIGFTFNASASNPIYGNSDTVQPKSITYLPIIRAF